MKSPKISQLLDKINRAIENTSFPAVSKLERDLLMQHIRNLYDEVDTDTLNAAGTQTNAETGKKEKVTEATVTIKRPAIRPNDGLLIKEETVVKKTAEFVKTEVPAVKEEKVVVAKAEVKDIKVEKPVQYATSSINESIKTSGSLNEKLKAAPAVEMHQKFAVKPLKELIDLNKKFVLLNELFKGNSEAYSKAITHIDNLPDYNTAQQFISTQLATNYYWDEAKQSTRMFTKLVKMKFGME